MTIVVRVPAGATGMPGLRVLLDGRASEAPGTAGYRWEILDPARGAQLTSADQAVAFLQATEPGLYSVRLTITDGDETGSAIVLVGIPRVDVTIAGPDSGTAGEAVTYDAGGSTVPAGARHEWSVEPPDQAILRADGATARLLPQQAGTYTVTLALLVSGFDATAAVETEIGRTTHTLVVDTRREGMPVATDDDIWWGTKQLDDTRAMLTAIAGSAARWQGLTATILGLFGAVAFVAGPKAVTEAASPTVARLSLGLVAAAFLTALVAVVRLAGVAHRAPQLGAAVTAADYRQAHVDAARHDLIQLRRAQHLTVAAGVLVATGSLILSFGSITAAAKDDPTYVLVRTDTETLCGPLSTTDDGALEVAHDPIGASADVQIVPSCGD